MGTRNLIRVIINGETKIAQYGQWDGYPEGQGKTILEFISVKDNVDKLRNSLKRVRFLSSEGEDKSFVDSYNENAPNWSSDPDNRTSEQKAWFKTYQSRDIAGDILANVANSDDVVILLTDNSGFEEEGSCEWSYIVNLDTNTFHVWDKKYDMESLPSVDDILDDFKDDDD